jgi:hypothetical protein
MFEENRETGKDWPNKGILTGKLRGFYRTVNDEKVKMKNGGFI